VAVATALAWGRAMRLVMTIDRSAATPWLEQLLEFHRAAGVDTFVDPGAEPEGDWVIEGGANEFWWPRGGSLREVLEAVPAKYGEIHAVVRHFVPVAGEDSLEGMIYRLSPQAPLNGAAPWRPERKPIRRRARQALPPVRGWYPVEVLRFHADAGGLDDRAIERAVRDGSLTRDERVSDALRTLAAGKGLVFPRPTVVEDALFAVDVALLGDADVIRVRDCLDALEERLAAVESTTPIRLERRLRSLVKKRLHRP
jgi:hypothetical protein